MQQIINMVLRMVMRQVMNIGIKKGMEMATKNRSRDDSEKVDRQDPQAAKKVQQTARMSKRMGRFTKF